MAVAFPGESAEYRAARDRLLEREIELEVGKAEEEALASRAEKMPRGEDALAGVYHAGNES